MAQQSSGEFASANPTKGEEDARAQERGFRAKISVSACRGPQHVQRPTSSYLSKNAPSLCAILQCERLDDSRCESGDLPLALSNERRRTLPSIATTPSH